MNLFLQYKWHILLACETIAWILTFIMFYARYWLNSNIVFWMMFWSAGFFGWVPHLTLLIWNLNNGKSIDVFTLVILALLIYGLTFGKKHLLKLDQKINRFLTNKKKSVVGNKLNRDKDS